MITSFFNTSKPIQFVIAGVVLFAVFFSIQLQGISPGSWLNNLHARLGVFGIVFFSVLTFGFFVNKNDLTQKNNYKVLFFVLFFLLLPETLRSNNEILANFFIILALRRIISLRTNLRLKKKLFDATFWIVIASLFYFWSILFLTLVFCAILLFSIGNTKNFIIPFTAVLTIAIMVLSYNIVASGGFGNFEGYLSSIGFDFTSYNDLNFIIPISIFFSLGIWATFFYIGGLKDKIRVYRPAFILVILALLIAISVIAITPNKSGSEFIFAFAPMAIIMSNYIESIKEKWFAELYVWLLVLTPIAMIALKFGSES